MDPQACFNQIVDAMVEGDIDEAIDASIDLGAWLNSGGFGPTLPPSYFKNDTSQVWAILGFLYQIGDLRDGTRGERHAV